MNITVETSELAHATAWASKAIPQKPMIPVLGGMLLETTPQGLHVGGFDYDTAMASTLPYEGDPGTKILVYGRLLTEIVKSAPGATVHLETNDTETHVRLISGSVVAHLSLLPIEDYPTLPQLAPTIGTIPAPLFGAQVTRVAPARDITGMCGIPELTGLYLRFSDTTIIVAATNRYQLAENTLYEYTPVGDDAQAILVPADAVATLTEMCQPGDELIIGASDHLVSFSAGSKSLVSRVLDASKFPQSWSALIPPRNDNPVVIDTKNVIAAIKRVSVALDGNPVELAFRKNVVVVAATGTNATILEEVPCNSGQYDEFDGFTIKVNPKFFVTALTGAGPEAEISMTEPNKPILVGRPDDDSYAHVLVPVRNT